ncbi:unnamed protein product [marine sediment metagenome]|uniref:Uncharacterized protein n=1 Tax=marine sediment metagenome TaxID=412755 RepID=X1C6K8_9ZZZZ
MSSSNYHKREGSTGASLREICANQIIRIEELKERLLAKGEAFKEEIKRQERYIEELEDSVDTLEADLAKIRVIVNP